MKKLLAGSIGVAAAVALALALSTSPALAKSHGGPGASHRAAPPAVTSKQSVTSGSVTVDGKRISYKAIAGVMVVKNSKDKPYVGMSYVAYIKKGVRDEARRPITFFYNGGPGSSTVWLQMLAYGPKLVVVGNGTLTPPAPYKLVNNDNTLLGATDEVFIDAPGTGFGRIITKKMGGVGTPKMVFGTDADARTFARFIQEYITVHNRWNSPKFLYGESYGTTRDAVLAYDLTRGSIDLNGVVFQSAVLNWNLMLDFTQLEPGLSLAYATGLPSEAATAWYHKKVPNQPKTLFPFLTQVEQFAMGPYLQALTKGNMLDSATKQKIAEQMHQYLGLPTDYILKANLRINDGKFRHELLGASDEITGRLDSRYTGPALDPMAENAEYGPLMSAIGSPTVALWNEYVRNTLKFGKGMVYKPMTNAIRQWDYNTTEPGEMGFKIPFTVNVMPFIADAMKLNPNMKVMLTGGYFDLGTPFFAAKYEFEHLTLPPKLQKNISYHFFQSGHMVYLNPAAHKGLTDATAAFIDASYKTK
ncbi:MAG: S10 family peptidase [Gammaproteobacteria bacterium]